MVVSNLLKIQKTYWLELNWSYIDIASLPIYLLAEDKDKTFIANICYSFKTGKWSLRIPKRPLLTLGERENLNIESLFENKRELETWNASEEKGFEYLVDIFCDIVGKSKPMLLGEVVFGIENQKELNAILKTSFSSLIIMTDLRKIKKDGKNNG